MYVRHTHTNTQLQPLWHWQQLTQLMGNQVSRLASLPFVGSLLDILLALFSALMSVQMDRLLMSATTTRIAQWYNSLCVCVRVSGARSKVHS